MVAMKYGSYVIGEVIGEGGMGVVYKAQHAVLKKPACVKRLLSQFTRSPEIVTRFVNEAVAASGLEHPNIVQVYDCAQSADGHWFIALEFLKGVPLSKWIRGETAHGVAVRKEHQGYPIAPAQICRILVQAASALHKAHTYVGENVAGIIHRDVKPDNIYLVRGGDGPEANDLQVKLLDFGIAKLRDPEGEGITRMGAIIGTPSYMAPEQLVNSKLVDPRADLYALGIVLYEMLTGGWIPWYSADGSRAEPGDIYHRQVTEPPPDPRAVNPAVSPAFAQFLARSLACDPRQRFASALEWARALAEVIPEDGAHPGGREILRRFAPDLYDHNDPLFGRRLSAEPVTRPDEPGWQPPVSAVSVATASLRPPPPPSAPSTTLGDSAAQSVPLQTPPRKSRAGLYTALGAVVAVVGIVIGAVSLSGGGTSNPAAKDTAAIPEPADVSPTVTTSVAVLTAPVGAAVFVDDELVGTSPTKVQLAPGRSVQVRAELAGHESAETTHVVGERAETVRLTLAPPIDAAVPIDAGVDAAPATTRTGSGRRPGGRRTPGSDGASAAGSSGTGAATTNSFDPEGIAR